MRKVTEVLRLNADGMRDVAASVGVGKTTVYEYLARADAVSSRPRRRLEAAHGEILRVRREGHNRWLNPSVRLQGRVDTYDAKP